MMFTSGSRDPQAIRIGGAKSRSQAQDAMIVLAPVNSAGRVVITKRTGVEACKASRLLVKQQTTLCSMI
jgi:hypothetical protein